MAKPDVEDVIDTLVSIFQNEFATNLALVDARKTEQLNPAPPRSYIFGDTQQTPQLPAMLFTSHQTQDIRDEYEWRNQQYTMTIEGYYAHTDLQTLSRIVRRYGAAIDDTLRQNNTLGGVVKNVTNIQQKYWETMKGQSGLFQAVAVDFVVSLITD